MKIVDESRLESGLRERVKKAGGLALKFYIMSFTGFPDRIVFMPGGRLFLVEVKKPGKKPNDRQLAVHAQLLKLGFPVHIIDSRESLEHVMTIILFT